jgi:hypothetical protein
MSAQNNPKNLDVDWQTDKSKHSGVDVSRNCE